MTGVSSNPSQFLFEFGLERVKLVPPPDISAGEDLSLTFCWNQTILSPNKNGPIDFVKTNFNVFCEIHFATPRPIHLLRPGPQTG